MTGCAGLSPVEREIDIKKQLLTDSDERKVIVSRFWPLCLQGVAAVQQ